MTTLEGLPEILFDPVVRNVVSNFLLHGHLPSEDFLVCEADRASLSTALERLLRRDRDIPMKWSRERE